MSKHIPDSKRVARRAMVSRRFDKKPEKKGATPKEQGARIGSGIW